MNMGPTGNDVRDFYIGVALAINSTVFIGVSFIMKKKSLLKMTAAGEERAADGGHGYLKDWLWWAGLLTMGVGEIANFTAYAFAPASVVTPLGGLSILVSAVLASYFLNEKLTLHSKLGCVICILGSTIIVLHAPREGEIESFSALQVMLQQPSVLTYCAAVVILALVLALYAAPRWGHKHVVIYVFLCSSVGSLTVMLCKAIGVVFKETFSGYGNNFENWLTWFLIVAVITCIMVQVNYLNRALDLFNTSVVTSVYYVLFTTFVMISTAVLFKEWENISAGDATESICGFVIINIAIIILNTSRDVSYSLSELKE